MKKQLFFLAGSAALATALLAGCDFGVNRGEQVDTSKTTIYVNNFNRGFGAEWLANYKKTFEELHANDSYEEGKTGVQIIINPELSPAETKLDNILDSEDEIYFTEQTDYYTLLQRGVVGDLTDCVSGKIAGEDKSILDKLTQEQKDFLNVDGHYYAIPHYTGYVGFSYDMDLFASKRLYFAADGKNFITNATQPKSVGPDGIAGTLDDGLPVTYEDFFKLADRMQNMNLYLYTANAHADYMTLFINSLVSANIGFDQMNIRQSCSGELTDLVDVNASGEVVERANETVTTANGYMFHHKRGIYDAIKFYNDLTKYLPQTFSGSGYEVEQAQFDFLRSNINGANTGIKPIGMIVEGNWWVNEASKSFADLADSYGEQYAKLNRNIAFMPLPKASVNDGNKTNTLCDHLSAISFIKKGIPEWKMPLINEFLQFCNSDESLISFTTTTNTIKALDYTIPQADLEKMSTYGRSLYELQKNSKIVRPYANTDFFRNNATMFKCTNQYKAKVDGLVKDNPISSLKSGVTPEAYFKAIYNYFEETWPTK